MSFVRSSYQLGIGFTWGSYELHINFVWASYFMQASCTLRFSASLVVHLDFAFGNAFSPLLIKSTELWGTTTASIRRNQTLIRFDDRTSIGPVDFRILTLFTVWRLDQTQSDSIRLAIGLPEKDAKRLIENNKPHDIHQKNAMRIAARVHWTSPVERGLLSIVHWTSFNSFRISLFD